jgi:hypothetical protein
MPVSQDIQDLNLYGDVVPQSEIQVMTVAGAINPQAQEVSLVTGGAVAYTLAAPLDNKRKEMVIYMTTDGGNATLTIAAGLGYNTVVFGDVGDCIRIRYNGVAWVCVSNQGCALSTV